MDDSKVAIKVITGYLENIGVYPLVAQTGKAALEIYRKERPDIILLDIILPDIDGFEVASKIRKLQGKDDWTAIIFLSVMSNDEDLARGIENGGDDYIIKPVGSVVVQAKVRAMYRLVEMQRSLLRVTNQLNQANEELQRLSLTDELTGVANRRLFDRLLLREWQRCSRHKKPISIVMVDVDYFKKFNDSYGHQAGDECLKLVAKEVARAAPRAGDLAARYGGEEFALVLGDTDADGARWVVERIRQRVHDLKVEHKESPHKYVSVSCGVSTMLPSSDFMVDKLIKSADDALYLAKKEGRNTVAYLDYDYST